MYSVWTRANALFSYASMVLLTAALASYATSFFFPQTPVVDLRIGSPFVRKAVGFGSDQASITFDLQADLTSLFNWNTKQLFLFITAEYETSKNKVNQVVVWDKLILDKESAVLNLEKAIGKYMLVDQGFGLRSNKIKFTLYWDLLPITGLNSVGSAGTVSVAFPSEYST